MDLNTVTSYRFATSRRPHARAGREVSAAERGCSPSRSPTSRDSSICRRCRRPDLEVGETGLRISATCADRAPRRLRRADRRRRRRSALPEDWVPPHTSSRSRRTLLASFKVWNTATVAQRGVRLAASIVALAVALDDDTVIWTPTAASAGKRRLADDRQRHRRPRPRRGAARRRPARARAALAHASAQDRSRRARAFGRRGHGTQDADRACVFAVTAATLTPTVTRLRRCPTQPRSPPRSARHQLLHGPAGPRGLAPSGQHRARRGVEIGTDRGSAT